MPWSKDYVEDKIEKYDAFGMMPIKKVMTADDRKTAEPVPPPPSPQEQRDVGSCGRCPQTCEVVDCPCEGFYLCVGHFGHQRRPHQCGVTLGIASGSASSQGVAPGRTCASSSSSSAAAAAALAAGEECAQTTSSPANDKEQEITSVIPRRLIEDALARLRDLRSDKERVGQLELYEGFKWLLANEL
jgi:hypothetical protein